MHSWVELFPVSASLHADAVDHLYYFLLIVSAFFAFLIFVLIITFAIRFHRSRNPIPQQLGEYPELEFAWAGIPFLITIVMFTWASKAGSSLDTRVRMPKALNTQSGPLPEKGTG